MLNPRSKLPIDWESTIPEKLSGELKSAWEARSTEFRKRREDLAQLVREGEMTLKAARQRAAELADELASAVETLIQKEKARTPILSRKLAEARRSKARPSTTEEAQKKTVELLMHNLTELQIANRKEEFEAKTFVKSSANSNPAPSLEKLFAVLEDATESGDAPAIEWCRRNLERLRDFVPDEAVRDRIDIVCDRPGVLNRRLIRKYHEAIAPRLQEQGFVEALLEKAVEVSDANAFAAIFEIARKSPDSVRPESLECVAAVIERAPDPAIRFALRTDREASAEEAACVDHFLESSLAWVERTAMLEDVRQPTEAEARRLERLAAMPPQAIDEPIGLSVLARPAYPGTAENSPADVS
ncbi:hypothetical protein GC170_08120 [bacterium]|nr:hypothetical protein [bacterium]